MDRLISQFEVIRTIEKYVDNIFTKNMGDLINDIKAIPSEDEDEWVKRSDVLRVVEKRIDERLLDPYKGMTNGEVVKTVFPNIDFCRKEFDDSMWVDMEDIASFRLDWWNSPYEPQKSER